MKFGDAYFLFIHFNRILHTIRRHFFFLFSLPDFEGEIENVSKRMGGVLEIQQFMIIKMNIFLALFHSCNPKGNFAKMLPHRRVKIFHIQSSNVSDFDKVLIINFSVLIVIVLHCHLKQFNFWTSILSISWCCVFVLGVFWFVCFLLFLPFIFFIFLLRSVDRIGLPFESNVIHSVKNKEMRKIRKRCEKS